MSPGDVEARPVRRIGFLLVENFSLMSFSAAVEPLRAANVLAERQLYSWTITAPSTAAASSNGARLSPDVILPTIGNLHKMAREHTHEQEVRGAG